LILHRGSSRSPRPDARPGIVEVARAASVSIATVSNVLNRSKYVSPELQQRVQRAVRRLRYRPDSLASSLRRQKTRTLGLLVSDVTIPFYTDLARAVEDRAAAAGYHVILGNTDEDIHKQQAYVDVFLSLRVAGLVITPAGGRSGDMDAPQRRGVPMVFVNRRIPGLDVPVVTCDNALGAFLATRHLLAHGHRRIGLLRPDWVASTIEDRTAGYRQSLREHGVPYQRDLVATGKATREEAVRLTDSLVSRAEPSALIVLSGVMVEGTLEALRRLGLQCPRDVALAAYNDQRMADFVAPPLTCVVQPTREMGRVAVDQLLRLIEGRALDAALQPLTPQLNIRESCGCQRAAEARTAEPAPIPNAKEGAS
jgi:LacI family transcriptional regulator